MKLLLPLFFLSVSSLMFGQTEFQNNYHRADSLFRSGDFLKAYNILNELEKKCDTGDTLYDYILWYLTSTTTLLEKQHRENEQFDDALKYALEALEFIQHGRSFFDESFAEREFWMRKNLIVNYFGLGQLDKAQEHRDFLYKARKQKALPEGIDEYFNFTFFKWKGHNIWGYEWYPELGDPETEGSFTKIVFYVYSAKPDGSDNEQLFRFHVKKFHKGSNSTINFDYILEKQYEMENRIISGTYFTYFYEKNINYEKLKNDIIEILNNDIQPSTQRSTIIR